MRNGRINFIVVFILSLLLLFSWSLKSFATNQVKKGGIKVENTQASTVELWLSTVDQKNLLKKQDLSKAQDIYASVSYSVNIDTNKKYQIMDGFGASLTDASAYLIYNKLTPEKRNEVMKKLFDRKEGIGISFLRQPMGASDFTTKIYSYDDMPEGQTDHGLKHFSIDHDKKYIIPLIKQAMKLNKDLKIMATPWSPPGWMKTSDNMIGGSLWQDCYQDFADYFVKFIKAYEKEGIPIYAISPQNEPLYVPSEYPGMKMTAEEQADFIKNYLGPAFKKNNIKTKILIYDHNWDNTTYASYILSDPEVAKYVDGSAWHCYGGKHEAMTYIHNLFPNKEIWFTEASGGEWVPPFFNAFMDQMMHVIRSTRNWAKSVVWWNMALDENNGPTVLSHSTCRGVLKINQKDGSVIYNLDYYTMGHISKFVVPGAYRIESSNYTDKLETVAFQNPDKSVVLIMSNRTNDNKKVNIKLGTKTLTYILPAYAAATVVWH
ncbi:glycoside hydrolase family 30 beta sandwich domain-containing protein [Caldicellulosiruptoraceae bacterium PP1]